jgi:hypothetical protein
MRGLFRTRQRKALGASVVATVGLIVGLLVGINAASGTNVPGLGPLDHYLCYTSTAIATPGSANVKPFPQKPVAAWLQNQFGSVLGGVSTLQRHCNPVQKTTPDGAVTGINRPNDHLACFGFTPNPNAPPQIVKVTNQFSPSDPVGPVAVPLQVGALQSLCLPSFKSLTEANVQPGAPDDLDHYSCYKVAYPRGATTKFATPSVKLDDQFTALLSPAQSLIATVLTPQSLCLPTIKIINPNPFVAPPTFKDLIDKDDHLLCFGLRVTTPVATPKSVFDSNQFGVGQVAIRGVKQLCVPSLKEVPPPTPTTTTTIVGATTTSSLPVTTTTCDPATGNCGTTTTTAPCTSGPNCGTMPPVFTKSFGATTIPVGGTTSLTFSISNPNPGVTLTGITVNDNLPGGLVVGTPNGLVPGCGGVFNVLSGGPLINMNGGFLAPLASCSFKVDVTAIGAPPNGLATNVTDPVITDQTGPGPQAIATIHVG